MPLCWWRVWFARVTISIFRISPLGHGANSVWDDQGHTPHNTAGQADDDNEDDDEEE